MLEFGSSAMIDVFQVCPPSKLTPSNIPDTPSATLATVTMFCGSVGFTAIVSSDSFPTRRLTSTLGGTLLPPRPAAPAGGAVDTAIMAATSGTTRTAIRRMSGTFWELGNLRP